MEHGLRKPASAPDVQLAHTTTNNLSAGEQAEIGATVTDPVTDPTSPLASDPKIQDDI